MAAFPDDSMITTGRMNRHSTSPGPPERQAKSKVENEDSGAQLDILTKAQEFFRVCDVEGKGFITRHNMQRLHGELPLSLEELEKVFDTLDADGNGSLTPEEFTSGFSQFLFGQKGSVSEMQGDGTENMDSSEEEDEDQQFSNLMETLGANKVLEDENDVKKLWSKLRKDEPHLLSSFEEFLARVFSQLQEADHEKNELESALRNKIAAYDEEIHYLYEEMEQQIKNEKEKFLLKDTERFQSRSQDLEHKLVVKEQELEQLAQKQKRETEMLMQQTKKETVQIAWKEEERRHDCAEDMEETYNQDDMIHRMEFEPMKRNKTFTNVYQRLYKRTIRDAIPNIRSHMSPQRDKRNQHLDPQTTLKIEYRCLYSEDFYTYKGERHKIKTLKLRRRNQKIKKKRKTTKGMGNF